MAGDVRVVEDGVEQRRPPSGSVSSWVWLVTGVAIGLGIGVVFFTPSGSNETGQVADVGPPAIAPIDEEDQPGIAQAIPGFPDALVAVSETYTGSLQYALWPVAGELVERPLPAGDFGEVRFDSSGRWLALTTDLPESDGALLSVGNPATISPLVAGVTSFAWHDSYDGVLAYTQEVEGEWLLSVVKANRNPEVVVRGVGIDGRVIAWGDWGWAVQDDTAEEVVLFTSSGDLKTRQQGTVFGSHPSGWIVVVEGDRVSLVSGGGGVQRLDISLGAVGDVVAAVLSPDADLIALVGSQGIKIAPVDGEGEVVVVPRTFDEDQVTWSSDSRFLVVPAARGVLIVDTGGGSLLSTALATSDVKAVAVIALSGSS